MRPLAFLPAALAMAGLFALVRWATLAPASFDLRVPGMDGTPATASGTSLDGTGAAGEKPVAGQPVAGPGTPAEIAGSWPGFRGPRRDAICDDGTPLARSWPAQGPPMLWQIPVEEGYAGAAIADGRVYVLDYVEGEEGHPGADTLRCLSLADGREIWRNGYPVVITPNHGITRTVPLVVEGRVITFGPRYHLACWDAATGANHWLLDLVRDFGTEERSWYNGQCPLWDAGQLVIAPGSPDCLMMALDAPTGEIRWKTPNPRGWKMTHASIMPMDFAGRRMYVCCGTGGTAGVAAADGALLWDETKWVEHFATSPSPLPLPDGRILLCSGYDVTGAMMLQLQESGGQIRAEPAFTLERKLFNAEQQTPIFYNGFLYGVKKLRGGQLVCLDLQGREVWNSGEWKFGHGPFLIADGKIVVLGEDGLLAQVEATHEAFRLLAHAQVFDPGREAWGPLAIASGRLVLRDSSRMACVDLR